MSQVYSNPERENDPHSLPDCEVFYMSADDFINADKGTWMFDLMQDSHLSPQETAEGLSGWYWWACFPGCLPDSEPNGPHASEQEAIDAAQEDYSEFEDNTQ